MNSKRIKLLAKTKRGKVQKIFPYNLALKLLLRSEEYKQEKHKVFAIDPESNFEFKNGDIIRKPKPKKEED